MDVLMFVFQSGCEQARLTAATLQPDPSLKDETFSWKPHLHNIIRSSNVPLYKKDLLKKNTGEWDYLFLLIYFVIFL